jgi:hypothetical protein
MPRDFKLSTMENLILVLHGISRMVGIEDIRALQLDISSTIEEQVPITIDQTVSSRIKRIQ